MRIGGDTVLSANEVGKLITDLKASGLPLSEVAWKAALACLGWAYVYGARGEYCDPTNRRSRASDKYPTIKGKCKNFYGEDDVPKGCVGCQWFLGTKDSDEEQHEGRTRFFDCRGFTYWILKQVYGFTLTGAGATTQWNTAKNWYSKGTIDSMPKDTLVCLFVKKGNRMEHTGFGYNNQTIECSAGVQYFAKRNKKWTHWAIPACVEGGFQLEIPDDAVPELKKGDRGSYVTLAQTKLIQKGFDCGSTGADGIFGTNTQKAVKAFQKACGLPESGIIDSATWARLDAAESVPTYCVTIPGLTAQAADELLAKYPGSRKAEEAG